MGDGGGCASSSSKTEVADSGDTGLVMESTRLDLDTADLLLRPDRTDATSDLSTRVSPLERTVELRGLSVFPPPGILDRSALKERDDSFVSDFPREGYDWRPSVAAVAPAEPLEPPLSFEFWFPIILADVSRVIVTRECPSLVPRRSPTKETSAQTAALRNYSVYTDAGGFR